MVPVTHHQQNWLHQGSHQKAEAGDWTAGAIDQKVNTRSFVVVSTWTWLVCWLLHHDAAASVRE